MKRNIYLKISCEKCDHNINVSLATLENKKGESVKIRCKECDQFNSFEVTQEFLAKYNKGENETIVISNHDDDKIAKLNLKVHASDKTKEQLITLEMGKNIIGRSTINTEDGTISRSHCIIEVVRKKNHYKYQLSDNNSTNGTYINGKKIQEGEEFYISKKDEVFINKTKISLI
jgi:hypothetical protein